MSRNRLKSVGRAPRVLIVQTYVPQYRIAFFNGLRARLADQGVHLDLIYSDPPADAAIKRDAVKLEWAIYLPNRNVGIGDHRLTYQPVAGIARAYDLVIVEQANKLLVNPILMVLSAVGMTRLAYWGHGRDFQGRESFWARAIKRACTPHVHWWFAYNELSAAVVRGTGFSDARITRVMNTIDNDELEKMLVQITPEEIEQQRQKLGLRGKNVCIYIGGMYDKKRLSFLLSACERVRLAIPDFEIIFLGSGVDKPLVESFAAQHEWAIVCGPTFGREKVVNLKLAKLLLMPGLVGLAIIDAFTAQVPIVTTNVPYHSPEIDYLIDGVNGEMTADNNEDYAARIVLLLRDENRLSDLRRGCREAARKYTMDAMVNNFAAGIIGAVNS